MITHSQYEIVAVSDCGVTEAQIISAPSILHAYRVARYMLIGDGKVSISGIKEGDLRKTFGPIFGEQHDETH